MHEPLHQPQEEHAVLDDLRAGRALHLAVRVVQEHQVEVRAVPQLDAAELAVGDDDHAGRLEPRIGRPAHRHAVTRGDLLPREVQRFLHEQLCEVRETVAHLHQRQPARQVRHRDPEHRRALELPQRIDLLLGVVGARAGHARAQFRLEFRARRRRSRTAARRATRRAASGKAAIWSDRNFECAQSSSSRSRARGFSLSRAR